MGSQDMETENMRSFFEDLKLKPECTTLIMRYFLITKIAMIL
jgi:hypothetical protein